MMHEFNQVSYIFHPWYTQPTAVDRNLCNTLGVERYLVFSVLGKEKQQYSEAVC